MYTRGFWNFQFRTAPSHTERARYFSTSRSGLWCIPKKPELLVSTTTLYPFLSHGPTIARGGQVHRTIFSTRIKGWFKKRERKIPTNEEIYPFLRSLLPVLCPLDLARFVTHCNRVPTSRKTRWFITLPPSKLISRLSTCRHHPTRCLSTLFLLALFRRHSPFLHFSLLPWIDALLPLSLSRACLSSFAIPVPLLLTPESVSRAPLAQPPGASVARAACTFHRPYYFHR